MSAVEKEMVGTRKLRKADVESLGDGGTDTVGVNVADWGVRNGPIHA